MAKGYCALCEQHGEIRNSHLISKFAGRWLKSMGSGLFRSPTDPKRPLQDIHKTPLLCDSCEGLLNETGERQFAPVFRAYSESSITAIPCCDWLRRFAVGLAWRTVVVNLRDIGNATPEGVEQVRRATRLWADWLLGRRGDPGPYEHHLILTRNLTATNPTLPPHFRWYLDRSTASVMVGGSSEILVVSKMPGLLFCAAIAPISRPRWRGTRIEEAGALSWPQTVDDERLAFWLVNDARNVFDQLTTAGDEEARMTGAMLPKNAGEIERLSLCWLVTDALAGRSTPVYDDTAQYYLSQAGAGEVRRWIIAVTNIDRQMLPEGEVTVVMGTNNSDPSEPAKFILRGRYEIRRGQELMIIRKAGYSASVVEAVIGSSANEQR